MLGPPPIVDQRLRRPGDCRRHPPSRGPVVLESRGALQRRRPEATGEEEREPNWITKAAPTAPAAGGARVPVRQGSLALPRRGRARGVGAGPVLSRRRCLRSCTGMRCGRRRPGGEGSVGALRRRGPRHLSTVAEATKAVKLADKTPRSRVAVTRGVCRPVYLRVPHSLSTWMYGEIALPAHEGAGADVGGDERASYSRQTDPVRAQGASRGRWLSRTAPPVRKAVNATARGCRSPRRRHPRGPSRCSRNEWRLPARGARRSTCEAPELGRV